MTIPWLSSLFWAAGLAAAGELVYLRLRRLLPRFLDRLRFQLWTASVTAGFFLLRSGLDERLPGLERFLAAALLVLSADIAWRLLDAGLLGRPKDARGRALFPKLVRDVVGWIVVAVAALAAARYVYGSDLSWLTLSTAVVSAVLGFALQDVLKNLFAGIALQSELPFEAGDWLAIDGHFAEVVEMSWRDTRLVDNLGVELVEPNAALAASRIVNYGSGETPVALGFPVALPYELPPEAAKRLLVEAARGAPHAAPAPAPQALVKGFGESGVDYELRVWTRHVEHLSTFRDAVLARVWYALDRERLSVPSPARAVAIRREGARRESRRADLDRRAAELLARIDFFRVLDAAEARALAARARHARYADGEVLVAEGDAGDSLLVVDRGEVFVSKSGAALGSAPLALATLGAGEFFGELSLVTGEPRSATVTAHGGCEVFEFDRAALAPLLEADPELAGRLSHLLAERAAATEARLADRRDELARRPSGADEASLRSRIRAFFQLDR